MLLHFFQNDYLDIYGIPEITGKEIQDIKEASLNWITAKAIEMTNEEQKEVLRVGVR